MNDLFSQLFNTLEPSKDEEEILPFSDYLDLLTREPWVARDSMQLLHDMLLSAGVEYNISPGKPLKHRYKFFEEEELIGPYVVRGDLAAGAVDAQHYGFDMPVLFDLIEDCRDHFRRAVRIDKEAADGFGGDDAA